MKMTERLQEPDIADLPFTEKWRLFSEKVSCVGDEVGGCERTILQEYGNLIARLHSTNTPEAQLRLQGKVKETLTHLKESVNSKTEEGIRKVRQAEEIFFKKEIEQTPSP